MKIWLDADACPRVIKEMIFRASERLNLPVLLVANKSFASSLDSMLTQMLRGKRPVYARYSVREA